MFKNVSKCLKLCKAIGDEEVEVEEVEELA